MRRSIKAQRVGSSQRRTRCGPTRCGWAGDHSKRCAEAMAAGAPQCRVHRTHLATKLTRVTDSARSRTAGRASRWSLMSSLNTQEWLHASERDPAKNYSKNTCYKAVYCSASMLRKTTALAIISHAGPCALMVCMALTCEECVGGFTSIPSCSCLVQLLR